MGENPSVFVFGTSVSHVETDSYLFPKLADKQSRGTYEEVDLNLGFVLFNYQFSKLPKGGLETIGRAEQWFP